MVLSVSQKNLSENLAKFQAKKAYYPPTENASSTAVFLQMLRNSLFLNTTSKATPSKIHRQEIKNSKISKTERLK